MTEDNVNDDTILRPVVPHKQKPHPCKAKQASLKERFSRIFRKKHVEDGWGTVTHHVCVSSRVESGGKKKYR